MMNISVYLASLDGGLKYSCMFFFFFAKVPSLSFFEPHLTVHMHHPDLRDPCAVLHCTFGSGVVFMQKICYSMWVGTVPHVYMRSVYIIQKQTAGKDTYRTVCTLGVESCV